MNSPSASLPSAGSTIGRRAPIRPETLHPALWLGHQLGRHSEAAVPSGYARLDAQLPGGGWPRRALSELLLPHHGVGEIRLLAPTLVATQNAGRLVMLFDPPTQLSASALALLGFDVEELLIIHTKARVIPGSDSLWALEQALKSGHVGAVLAWLPPRLRAERLRRLQLAAHAHDGPAFVLREMNAAQLPTSAPLRLALKASGADVLAVRVLKRRGPLLSAPVLLELPPVLSDLAQQRAQEGAALRLGAGSNSNAGESSNADAGSDSDTDAEADALTSTDAQNAGFAAASYTQAVALRAATFVNLASG